MNAKKEKIKKKKSYKKKKKITIHDIQLKHFTPKYIVKIKLNHSINKKSHEV